MAYLNLPSIVDRSDLSFIHTVQAQHLPGMSCVHGFSEFSDRSGQIGLGFSNRATGLGRLKPNPGFIENLAAYYVSLSYISTTD